MNPLIVRQLLIDLDTPFALRWNGGDAFASAFMNALSLSFPAGEQFFLDSVREGLKQLPADQQALFKDEVKGFIGQEATHRRLHTLYNRHLLDQGMVNHWEQRALKRIAILDDYQGLALTLADWSALGDAVSLQVFNEPASSAGFT